MKVSVRGVCFDDLTKPLFERRVLLMNEGGWRLPGGKQKKNEGMRDAVIREFLEETGLTVRVVEFVSTYIGRKKSGKSVKLVYFLVRIVGGTLVQQVRPTCVSPNWFDVARLPNSRWNLGGVLSIIQRAESQGIERNRA